LALDPQIGALLERMEGAPAMSEGTPEAARESFRRLSLASAAFAPAIEVAGTEELTVDGGEGPLPARLYRPAADGAVPTLAFFHGGGFTVGDIASYDSQARLLCRDGGVAVVSFEYRLAPENPFPAAVEDAVAATTWVLDHAAELGGDAERVAVGGDSAGANLAAVSAQELRGRERGLAGQLLIYPVTDFATTRASVEENGEGLFLTADDMRWFESNYLPEDVRREDPRVSPLLAADLSGLPPAALVTAELDPLRDDGEAYAEALAAAGVRVITRRFDGLVHGFFAMGAFSAAAREAVGQVCADLRELLV